MPNTNETERVARKLLPIIYVLDTSGSMAGSRISSVNEAMHDTIDVLKEVAADNPTAELKIGVLQFSSNAKWITDNGFLYPDDFYWNDLPAGGLTSMGAALDELNKKLSRSAWLNSPVGYKVPVIIFMSDGEPTDDYKKALDKLNATNKWFKASTKIGIAVDDANVDVLQEIVGSKEAVIQVNDNETLKKLIRVVSVTASMIGSKSRTSDDSQGKIMEVVNDEIGNKPAPTPAPAPDPAPTPQPTGGKASDPDTDDDWPDDDWS